MAEPVRRLAVLGELRYRTSLPGLTWQSIVFIQPRFSRWIPNRRQCPGPLARQTRGADRYQHLR